MSYSIEPSLIGNPKHKRARLGFSKSFKVTGLGEDVKPKKFVRRERLVDKFLFLSVMIDF